MTHILKLLNQTYRRHVHQLQIPAKVQCLAASKLLFPLKHKCLSWIPDTYMNLVQQQYLKLSHY